MPSKSLVSFRDAAVDPLWSNMSFDIEPGEFIAVLGPPNGVGKSTLLGTILRTRQLTDGRVDVNCRVAISLSSACSRLSCRCAPATSSPSPSPMAW